MDDSQARADANCVGYLDSTSVGDYVDLGLLWHELLAGHVRVSGAFHTASHCLMGVVRGTSTPVRPERARILERVLMGESQKAVGYDVGLGASTITSACQDVLSRVAHCRRVSHAPLLLVMAVHSARGARSMVAHVDEVAPGVELLLSASLPKGLVTMLSPSEGHVVNLVLEGSSHAAVASRRHTSPRTTANQLASIFKKLGISGMGELRSKLVQGVGIERGAG